MAADPIDRLTTLLKRLPGLGEKSAMRQALAIVAAGPEYIRVLAAAVADTAGVRRCEVCCDLCGSEVCSICRDAKRDPSVICVVSTPQERIAVEKAAIFRGRYHVLHGVLDPLAGVGPAELTMRQLVERLRVEPGVIEVIVATGATVEGDATALYLARLLEGIVPRVSRIATGMAVGGDLEHADIATLSRALGDRREI